MNPKSNRTKIKKKILIESFIVLVLALVPFLFKVYDYLPGPNHPNALEPISFLGISVGGNGFDSVSTNVWFYTNKLIPLVLLVFWFFTSKNWWYHIIIIPIATYAFQLFELIYSENDVIDSENIWWILPVCMVVIPFVYLIRIKLVDKYVHGIDLEAMEAELEVLRQKEGYKKPVLKVVEEEEQVDLSTLSFSERINYLLSTKKLESYFRNFQNTLQGWLHLKS